MYFIAIFSFETSIKTGYQISLKITKIHIAYEKYIRCGGLHFPLSCSQSHVLSSPQLYAFQPAAPISTTMEATLPGLGAYKTHVSMKVTNMQLVSYTDKMWSGGVCLSDDGATMQNQQEFQRGGSPSQLGQS